MAKREKTKLEALADLRISGQIQQMREFNKLTRAELAVLCNTTAEHITEIEEGECEIEVYMLRRITTELGYDCRIIMERRYEA